MNKMIAQAVCLAMGMTLAFTASSETISVKCTCKQDSNGNNNQADIADKLGTSYTVQCAKEYFTESTTGQIDVDETDAKVAVDASTGVTTNIDSSSQNVFNVGISPRDNEQLKEIIDKNNKNKSYSGSDINKNKQTYLTLSLDGHTGKRMLHFDIVTTGKDYEGFVVVEDYLDNNDGIMKRSILGPCIENLGDQNNSNDHNHAATYRTARTK